tara:strand:- start:14961 stop:15278 length:318 start_codon:yes stop_codon:yes gene_type:complete
MLDPNRIADLLTVRMATDFEALDNEAVIKFHKFAKDLITMSKSHPREDYNRVIRSLKIINSYRELPIEYRMHFNNGYLKLLLDIKNTLVEGARFSLTHPDAICLN